MKFFRKDYDGRIIDKAGIIKEPCFLLRAQDQNAVEVLLYWQSLSGIDISETIEAFKKVKNTKAPDLPKTCSTCVFWQDPIIPTAKEYVQTNRGSRPNNWCPVHNTATFNIDTCDRYADEL